MCDICRIAIGALALPHQEAKCPFQKSQYCGYCLQYGHSTNKCQFYTVQSSIIEEDTLNTDSPYRPILDVVDTPHCIRAVLSAFQVKLSGRPKENMRRLNHIAECGTCLAGDEAQREACLYAGKTPTNTHKGRRLVLHKPRS